MRSLSISETLRWHSSARRRPDEPCYLFQTQCCRQLRTASSAWWGASGSERNRTQREGKFLTLVPAMHFHSGLDFWIVSLSLLDSLKTYEFEMPFLALRSRPKTVHNSCPCRSPVVFPDSRLRFHSFWYWRGALQLRPLPAENVSQPIR